MLTDFAAPFNWLFATLRRATFCPPPGCPCPLKAPDAPLPASVATDPLVQKYLSLIHI